MAASREGTPTRLPGSPDPEYRLSVAPAPDHHRYEPNIRSDLRQTNAMVGAPRLPCVGDAPRARRDLSWTGFDGDARNPAWLNASGRPRP